MLIIKNKPKKIIEIGVYRGTRSLEMIECAKIFNTEIYYFGFDLFDDFENSILNKAYSPCPTLSPEIAYNAIVGLCKKSIKSLINNSLFNFFY